MSSHEEQVRQVRETKLRLQQEVRRNAPRRFGPAVDGVLWSRLRPEETAGSQQAPILSVLEFKLKPEIHLDDRPNPPRKLWDAALCYIRSIPGCRTVEWGLELGDLPTASQVSSLSCLIHWDNTVAWHKFQHSLGFTPLVALFGSSPSNRCAKLSPSDELREFCDARSGTTIVDVVSVVFGAEDASSPEKRSAFEAAWHEIASSLAADAHEGPRHSRTVWLENNASTFWDPTPAEAAAANELATFTAFFAWDGAHYDIRRVEDFCSRLRASLPPMPSDPDNGPSISKKTLRLINRLPQLGTDHESPQRRPAGSRPLTGLAALLLEANDIRRQCSPDLFRLRENGQQVLAQSISDSRGSKLRLFPAPAGTFVSQGELYDGNTLPPIPHWKIANQPGHDEQYRIDVVWIHLRRGAPKTRAQRVRDQLADAVSTLPGFVKTVWARDVEHQAKAALFTVWEDEHARGQALPQYHRILDHYAASSADLAAPLTHQNFQIAGNSRDPVFGWVKYLELTSFHIPPGKVERVLFEHAYGAFTWMTEPSQMAGIPTACTVLAAGGWQPAGESPGSSEYQVFTGVLSWASQAARQEWYDELSKASRGSYELFGHHLDALKLLAEGGVVSRFLALQNQ
ncbi:hypothetical protein P885DRAFT_67471 [Corynascus similis CBS 632.67]